MYLTAQVKENIRKSYFCEHSTYKHRLQNTTYYKLLKTLWALYLLIYNCMDTTGMDFQLQY